METTDKGLQKTVRLSYALVAGAPLKVQEKRSLLFSLYCFLCVFDDGERLRASKTLIRNGCSFLSRDLSLLNEPHTVHIQEKANGRGAVKFDAGSPLYGAMVKSGRITGAHAVYPEKLPLYTMIYRTVTLPGASDELKALWYIYLPAVPLLDAPMEYDIYDELKRVLLTTEVFAAVAVNPYAGALNTDLDALLDIDHPIVREWTGAYLTYMDRQGRHELYELYRRQIENGNAANVAVQTQRLLDRRPLDAELWVLYLAACAEEIRTTDEKRRRIRIAETLSDIQSALETDLAIERELYYTRALMRLAEKNIPAAIDDLAECIEQDPTFTPALQLLTRLKDTLNLN